MITGAMAGCSSENNAQPADTESILRQSIAAETAVKEESIDEISYPEGTEEVNTDSLKYKSADGKLNVTFPKDFIKKLDSISSESGIYLSTSDGKATLQLDHIKCEGVNRDNLRDFLEEKYKDSKAETGEDGTLIFKVNTTDKKKNKVTCCLKAVVKDNGYCQAILSYHQGDENKYLPQLEKIIIQP